MDSLASVLKRDRLLVGAGIVLVTILAWWYTVAGARQMDGAMMVIDRPDPTAWTSASLLPLFVMWVVMMVAMMLPTATPMILMFGAVVRNGKERRQPYVPVAVFVGGTSVSGAASALSRLWRNGFCIAPRCFRR